MRKEINLICPLCKRNLRQFETKHKCENCNRDFPIIFGIPDFRIFPLIHFTPERESQNVPKLVLKFRDHNYLELASYMLHEWNKEKNPELLKKYLNSWSKAVERNAALYKRAAGVNEECKTSFNGGEDGLDIGCGAGGMLIQLSSNFSHVVGIDVSFESLIISKKLLEEYSIKNVQLICCETEFLPFCETSFDIISASNVIEHVRNQKKTIDEVYRVQRKRGIFFGDIPNRYSLTPEPHVNLKFVGFMPRKLGIKYVRLMRNRNYIGYHLPSYFELKKIFDKNYKNNYYVSFVGPITIQKLYKHSIIRKITRRVTGIFCDYFIVVAKKV